jgi:uncharacterized membrane protein YbaN (DUF454 family)
MNRRLRKFLDWTIGLILIGIGIIGGFVPILQGWIFILAGLAVLSSHSAHAHRLNEWAKGIGRNVKEKVRARRERGRGDESGP